MKAIDVAYGVPARSVSEAQLREALRSVAANFDASPTRMHAVLGPPGPIRWFSFACTVFRRDFALAQDHFSEVMEIDLDELLVAVRHYGDEPALFEHRRRDGRGLTLARNGDTIDADELPDGAHRDGEIDEIALDALGLPIVRPFAALAAPTHEVVLRGDQVDDDFPIVPLRGAVLPVRVHPRFAYGTFGTQFARTPRKVTGDTASLNAHVERGAERAEKAWIAVFDGEQHMYARELVRVGSSVAPILVGRLAQQKPKPRTSTLALIALGMLGVESAALVPWLARSSEALRLAAFCALARQGEAARPALLAASTSKKSAERVAAQALLSILDAQEFAALRAVRDGRDANGAALARAMHAAVEAKESGRAIDRLVFEAPLDAVWGVAQFLIECPINPAVHLANYAGRDSVIKTAAARFGADFGPVADVLLRFPPLADDFMLQRLAGGHAMPNWNEIHDARDAKRKAKRKAKAQPKAKAKTKSKPKKAVRSRR